MEATEWLLVISVILVVAVCVLLRWVSELRNRVSDFIRVEAKIGMLLEDAELEYDPYAKVPADVEEAILAGNLALAAKLYRDVAGVDVFEAESFVGEVNRRSKQAS